MVSCAYWPSTGQASHNVSRSFPELAALTRCRRLHIDKNLCENDFRTFAPGRWQGVLNWWPLRLRQMNGLGSIYLESIDLMFSVYPRPLHIFINGVPGNRWSAKRVYKKAVQRSERNSFDLISCVWSTGSFGINRKITIEEVLILAFTKAVQKRLLIWRFWVVWMSRISTSICSLFHLVNECLVCCPLFKKIAWFWYSPCLRWPCCR